MRQLLGMSSSGYYDWRERPLARRSQANTVLTAKIKAIFDNERSRVGARRIAKRLNLEGTLVSRHRIAKHHALKGLACKSS